MARKARLALPPPITEALASFGAGLKSLRVRRRMPVAYAADRASISRSTLYKVERGDPGVGIGIYAIVIKSYGMLHRLSDLAAARYDGAGLALEDSRLPQRIRRLGFESPRL